MRIELLSLGWSAGLGIIYLLAAAQAVTAQRGLRWNFGNRDSKMPEVTGVALRLSNASKNFMETFPFFAVGILLVHLTDSYSAMTILGAQLYFWARVVYLPVYAVGIPYVRTATWTVSLVGIVLVLLAPFI
jgi:uncharacterized MAPEG superfamily protein